MLWLSPSHCTILTGSAVLVQPYGKEWSIRRKLLHSALTPRALQNYIPVQQAEACRLCYQLLARPGEWEQLLDWMTASIVFSISYGHRIDSMDSPVIRERMSIMHYNATLNVPGKYLAESFPILKHTPLWLAPWKRDIKHHGAIEANANMRLTNYIKHEMEEERRTGRTIPNSLCKQLLERRARDPESFALLSDRDFSFIPSSLFGAGADTTASSLCSAFLALVTHPATLDAAHAELDAVIGSDRLPTFADEASLPYLRALCKEVLRWRPVAVLGGTPHATTASDVYEGWFIPKDTNVLGNTWAINHNEKYYPNSHHFNPLRFLDEEPSTLGYLPAEYVRSTPVEKGSEHPSKLGHSSFGWGRRICPGAELASNNLYIALATLLWCFDIKPIKGVEYDTWDYVGKCCHTPFPLLLCLPPSCLFSLSHSPSAQSSMPLSTMTNHECTHNRRLQHPPAPFRMQYHNPRRAARARTKRLVHGRPRRHRQVPAVQGGGTASGGRAQGLIRGSSMIMIRHEGKVVKYRGRFGR